jgi:hypothetical protein
MTETGFLTVAEAAELAGVCRATIYRRIKRIGVQTVPDRLDGNLKLIRVSDLELLTTVGAAVAAEEARAA